MTENPRRDAAAVWQGRIEAQAASGLTIADFCKQQPYSTGSFYHWKRRLALSSSSKSSAAMAADSTDAPHRFVQVPAAPRPADRTDVQRIELILPGGTIIRLPTGDPQSLELVLKNLRHNF